MDHDDDYDENYDDNCDGNDENHQDCFANFFLFSPVFNYWLPACWSNGTALEDKLHGFVWQAFIFVFVLVVYLYEINYLDLSDCLYLL